MYTLTSSTRSLTILMLQVTTTTKTIREVQYIGPDGQPLDYIPDNGGGGHMMYEPGLGDYQNYQMYPGHGAGVQYPARPPTPPTPSERSNSPQRLPGKMICSHD